jgi:hypothetical protein
MAQHFRRSEPTGHVHGTAAERHAELVLVREHVKLRAVAQRPRQFLFLAERLQYLQRLLRALSGQLVVAKEPREP